MLLMFDYITQGDGQVMPMTILNVHDGKPIMNFSFDKQPDSSEFEFLE